MAVSTIARAGALLAVFLEGCFSARTGSDGGSDAPAAERDARAAVDSGPSCVHPATTTYACEALPAGEPGCTGPPPGGDPIPGPGTIVPEGCSATLPFCHAYYPAYAASCECRRTGTPSGGAFYDWACPL